VASRFKRQRNKTGLGKTDTEKKGDTEKIIQDEVSATGKVSTSATPRNLIIHIYLAHDS